MKCPNCQFEMDAGSQECAFCHFVIPKDGPKKAAAPLPQPDLPPVPGMEELAPGPREGPAVPLVGTAQRPAGASGLSEAADAAPPRTVPLWAIGALTVAFGVAAAYMANQLGSRAKTAPASAPPKAAAPASTPAVPVSASQPPPSPSAPALPPVEPQAAPPPSGPPRPATKIKRKDAWEFEGRVYDLLTLRPVFNAQLSFLNGSRAAATRTDEQGRYRIRLPPSPAGYRVQVIHEDYRPSFLEEISPPYRVLDLDERKSLRTLKPTSHKPWTRRKGDRARRDLVLIPAGAVIGDVNPEPAEAPADDGAR